MRTYDKSQKLNNVCYEIRGPVTQEAARMEQAGQQVLKLNIGNPAPFGFTCPPDILQAMQEGLRLGQGYTDSKGLPAARAAVAGYCKHKGIAGVTMEDVYIGNGVSELILMSMQALLDSGDEILIPAPDYPLWTAAATLAGGRAVHYLCDEASGWLPDTQDIRRKITPRTKGIVLINPNNPTGALYPSGLLQDIAAIAREKGLILFSDEIYDRLVMDGLKHTSIAALAPEVFCVTFGGLSKSHRVAGFRCGWMCLSGDRSGVGGYIEGLNLLSSMRLCAGVPAQYMVEKALSNPDQPDPDLLPGGRIYEQRACVVQALRAIPGVSVVQPQAAFYIFPRLDGRFNIRDDERFALDLLREKQVLIVSGSGFNWPDADHFRIVYLPECDVLRQGVEKIGDFLQGYRQ